MQEKTRGRHDHDGNDRFSFRILERPLLAFRAWNAGTLVTTSHRHQHLGILRNVRTELRRRCASEIDSDFAHRRYNRRVNMRDDHHEAMRRICPHREVYERRVAFFQARDDAIRDLAECGTKDRVADEEIRTPGPSSSKHHTACTQDTTR